MQDIDAAFADLVYDGEASVREIATSLENRRWRKELATRLERASLSGRFETRRNRLGRRTLAYRLDLPDGRPTPVGGYYDKDGLARTTRHLLEVAWGADLENARHQSPGWQPFKADGPGAKTMISPHSVSAYRMIVSGDAVRFADWNDAHIFFDAATISEFEQQVTSFASRDGVPLEELDGRIRARPGSDSPCRRALTGLLEREGVLGRVEDAYRTLRAAGFISALHTDGTFAYHLETTVRGLVRLDGLYCDAARIVKNGTIVGYQLRLFSDRESFLPAVDDLPG